MIFLPAAMGITACASMRLESDDITTGVVQDAVTC
jgi:hypothetical protein